MTELPRTRRCWIGSSIWPARRMRTTIQPFGETETIKSLEEGLGKSFQSEVLDGANQYFCERCNAKKDADKGARLSKVPYIMTVNLKRFDSDWERDCRCKIAGMVAEIPGIQYVKEETSPMGPAHKFGSRARKPEKLFLKNDRLF